MDYKKAYKEVFDKAKNKMNNECSSETTKAVCQELFPKLAESEDERIRKAIIDYLSNELHNVLQLTPRTNEVEAWIAYLERQKENPKAVDSIPSFCVSDVKWADTIITRAIISLSMDVDFNRDEPYIYRREIDDLMKLRDILCGQKEQKPELYDMGRWDEESYNNGINHVLQNPEAYGLTKQQPAEWNEEDEKMFELLHTCVCRCINDERFDYAEREQISRRLIPFLERIKSLRPHWKPSD